MFHTAAANPVSEVHHIHKIFKKPSKTQIGQPASYSLVSSLDNSSNQANKGFRGDPKLITSYVHVTKHR